MLALGEDIAIEPSHQDSGNCFQPIKNGLLCSQQWVILGGKRRSHCENRIEGGGGKTRHVWEGHKTVTVAWCVISSLPFRGRKVKLLTATLAPHLWEFKALHFQKSINTPARGSGSPARWEDMCKPLMCSEHELELSSKNDEC